MLFSPTFSLDLDQTFEIDADSGAFMAHLFRVWDVTNNKKLI